MGLNIPMNRKGAMNRNSLAGKQGLMNVRGSLDKRTLNNNIFGKNPVNRNEVPASSAPVRQSKKQSNTVNSWLLYTSDAADD